MYVEKKLFLFSLTEDTLRKAENRKLDQKIQKKISALKAGVSDLNENRNEMLTAISELEKSSTAFNRAVVENTTKAVYRYIAIGNRYSSYQIGGDNAAQFLVRSNCHNALFADNKNDRETPAGYRWAVAASISDIEWNVMAAIEDRRFNPATPYVATMHDISAIFTQEWWHPCSDDEKKECDFLNRHLLELEPDTILVSLAFFVNPDAKFRDSEVLELWEKFDDISMNTETECIEEEFLHFPIGTHREEIWHWFDEHYSKGVYDLLYNTLV